jgi:hypothetical protein
MLLSYAQPNPSKARTPLCRALMVAGAVLWLIGSCGVCVLAAAFGRADILPALPCGMVVAVVAYLAQESPLARAFWRGVLVGVLTLCGPLFFAGMLIIVACPK